MDAAEGAIRNEIGAELTRRRLLDRAGRIGLAGLVAGALPALEGLARPEPAAAQIRAFDPTLQAYFDTIIPGRRVDRTELGNPIHPQAIAGVDPEPGAVEADSLLLAQHPKIGFDAIAPAFVAELELRAVAQGGPFLGLDYETRERACIAGLDYGSSTRVLWEAAAAVPFAAFCGAANVRNATRRTSVGLRVMGHPGTAPRGYPNFSYRRRLARGRTRNGNLP